MNFRWWNSFNILGIILLAIGLIGVFSGGRMVFDPGRTPTGKEWLVYLIAGGLMLVNGFLPGTSQPPAAPASPNPRPTRKPQP